MTFWNDRLPTALTLHLKMGFRHVPAGQLSDRLHHFPLRSEGRNFCSLTGRAQFSEGDFCVIGLFLIWIGRPDQNGVHHRFLQFEAALVLYPPFILIFFAFGAVTILSELFGK